MKFKKYFILVTFFLTSCDFSSRLNQDILDVQEKIKERDYQQAVILYQNIIDRKPPEHLRFKIYFQLADLNSIYLNNQIEAKKYFELLIAETNDPKWLLRARERLAEINFEYLHNYKEAIEIYTLLTSYIPKLEASDKYEYLLALAYLKNSNYAESEKRFLEISRDSSHEFFVNSFFHLGIILFEQKKWKEAIVYWKEYIKNENPQKNKNQIVEVKFLIANAFETMENLKEAYDVYFSLQGEYPNNDVVKNRLKSIYSRRVNRKR
jgi:tetratricopeptide (TPR) repeat protein